ncbi:MAG TPA: hypothetical protein VGV09_01895 [Steroidobacteraceae bacterium]|nr:hypothetical protein [Steroidobacteraceae bacterium]
MRRRDSAARKGPVSALMESADWKALCDAENALCKAGKILCGAGCVLRSGEDSASIDPTLAASVLDLIGHADKAIRQSLDLLAGIENPSYGEIIGGIIGEVYSLHGLVIVARYALMNRDQIECDTAVNPFADALEIAGGIAGQDPGDGIAGKIGAGLLSLTAQAKGARP